MLNFFTFFTNTNGVVFPGTLAINASGPSATDGTEFVKGMIDDIWGWYQAMLDYAGLTPSGVTEAPGASQMLEAIGKGFAVGPGFGVTYYKDGDPAVNGDRVLLLNGQGILRANYPELDAAVYVGDANNAAVAAGGGKFYRADDAAGVTPNIAGIYLILPESRGYSPRGLDLAASVDPDGAGRFLGDVQLDSFQGWQAGVNQDTTGARDYWGLVGARDLASSGAALANHVIVDMFTGGQGDVKGVYPKDDGTNGTPRTSTETRMVNTSVINGITY
jgi:hypothetical protein